MNQEQHIKQVFSDKEFVKLLMEADISEALKMLKAKDVVYNAEGFQAIWVFVKRNLFEQEILRNLFRFLLVLLF